MRERKSPVCGSSDPTSFPSRDGATVPGTWPDRSALDQPALRCIWVCIPAPQISRGTNSSESHLPCKMERAAHVSRVCNAHAIRSAVSRAWSRGTLFPCFQSLPPFSSVRPGLRPWLASGKTATGRCKPLLFDSQIRKKSPFCVRTAVNVPCGGPGGDLGASHRGKAPRREVLQAESSAERAKEGRDRPVEKAARVRAARREGECPERGNGWRAGGLPSDPVARSRRCCVQGVRRISSTQ